MTKHRSKGIAGALLLSLAVSCARAPLTPQEQEAKKAQETLASRTKEIDENLAAIQKARENGEKTADRVMDLLAKEKSWGFVPQGQAVFTQSSEIAYAGTQLIQSFGDSKSPEYQGFPLKKEADFQRYSVLFTESHSWDFNSLRIRNRADGQAQCVALSKITPSADRFLLQFLRRFCSYWGAPPPPAPEKPTDLAQGFVVRSEVDTLSPEDTSVLSKKMNEALRESPWFASDGQAPAELTLRGQWKKQLQREMSRLSRDYQGKESYTENESVMKTRQVPDTVVTYVPNPVTGDTDPVPTTEWKTETYWATEPVTKTRPMNRTIQYDSWKVTQTLALRLELEGRVSDHPLRASLSDESRAQDTESDADLPEAGLAPKHATQIPDPEHWLRTHADDLKQSLFKGLQALWSELYCSKPAAGDFASQGEVVQRCRKVSGPTPAFVNAWYQKTFGLTANEVDSFL